MARPFVRRPLHRRSFFDRLLGRARKDNAVVEINNLLADAADVTGVSFEQVAADVESGEISDAFSQLAVTLALATTGRGDVMIRN